MHNKEQLQKQAHKLQEELDKLKQQIEECDKEETDRVQRGKPYFYLSSHGYITETLDKYQATDDIRYELGNYFKTKDEAIEYRTYLETKMKLKMLAKRLNKGKLMDWQDDNQQKYYLFFNHEREEISMERNQIYQHPTIYCLSSNFRNIAISEIGKQALIDYLKSEV